MPLMREQTSGLERAEARLTRQRAQERRETAF